MNFMEENMERFFETTPSAPDTVSSLGLGAGQAGSSRIHCVTIMGQVEGHYAGESGQKSTRYEQLLPHLVSVEEDASIGGVLFLIHTIGGDVEAGLAIAELIAGMQKPTASIVLGGGHSIGVPLAVSADRTFIVPSATMTLHPVRTTGLVLGAPQSFSYLSKMQARIERFILEHSHADAEDLHRMMMQTDEIATDMGTILCGEEALRAGLVDAVGGLAEALAYLRERIKDG